MKTSLIITTYNSPDRLELVLLTVLAQTEMPDEVLVADDGSGPETAALIRRMAVKCPVPLIHVWHEDCGFRVGTIRNKAIKRASGDYIIQIDGDMMLHPDFVADHKSAAKPGHFIIGSRVSLKKEFTEEVISRKLTLFPILKYWLGMRHAANRLRLPIVPLFFSNLRSQDITYARSSNMAVWKSDLLKVNGYNEDINGWGREDSELSCRLYFAGVKKGYLKFKAVQYHLSHPTNGRSYLDRNTEIMNRTIAARSVMTPNGITKQAK